MSEFNRYLDTNYRMVGDRIITERQYQYEQNAELLGAYLGWMEASVPFPHAFRQLGALIGTSLLVAVMVHWNLPWWAGLIAAVIGAPICYYGLTTLLIAGASTWIYFLQGWGWALATAVLLPFILRLIGQLFRELRDREARVEFLRLQREQLRVTPLARKLLWAVLGLILLLTGLGVTLGLLQSNTTEKQAAVTSQASSSIQRAENSSRVATESAVVRAFYSDLNRGAGAEANSLLIPEKRALPYLSPKAFHSFYGSMAEPMRLLDLTPAGPHEYETHYRYRMTRGGTVCDDYATIELSSVGGRILIKSIRPVGRC